MAASTVGVQLGTVKRNVVAQNPAIVPTSIVLKASTLQTAAASSDQDCDATPDHRSSGGTMLKAQGMKIPDADKPHPLASDNAQEAVDSNQLSADPVPVQQEAAHAPAAEAARANKPETRCSKHVHAPRATVRTRTNTRTKNGLPSSPRSSKHKGQVAEAEPGEKPLGKVANKARKTAAGPSQPPNKKAKRSTEQAHALPGNDVNYAPETAADITRFHGAAAGPLQPSNKKAKVAHDKEPSQAPANRKRKAQSAPVDDIPPFPEPSQQYEYAPGHEPYRQIGVAVNETQILDVAARAKVVKAQDLYSKMYREARVVEDARHVASDGVNAQGRAISKRPDLVARSNMEKAKAMVNTSKVAGHVPGIAVFDRFYLRAEMGVVGMHFSPLGGIDYVSKSDIRGCPQYATSIMVCGGYEDDTDDGHELIYTGQGGNDLLGNRQQTAEQQLRLGNLALVGNIRLGIPVRVTRKNKEPDAICGSVFIYDGLYNVVKYWLEKGKQGFAVYQYLLRRQTGQGDLATSRVEFGGKSAPKGLSALTRPGVYDVDISCGKEPRPIVGVNEINDEVVPFSEAGHILREQDMKGNPLTHLITDRARAAHTQTLRYITTCTPVEGEAEPPVPVLPASMGGCPHTYVEYLNGGLLPYHDRSGTGKVRHSQARRVQAVLYECGPWAGCIDGPACCQAASQQGCQYRLEVFQTPDKGWGVRSWDTIPNGAFVMNYTGRTKAADEVEDDEMDYTFDLAPRPYNKGDEELPLFPKAMWETHKQANYVLDAKHEGNVARFINHSCDPNLYVQPALSRHHDITQTQVCLFAGQNIAPMTELTFDYGHEFLKDNLKGNCNCGSAMCVGPEIKQQLEEEEGDVDEDEEVQESKPIARSRKGS